MRIAPETPARRRRMIATQIANCGVRNPPVRADGERRAPRLGGGARGWPERAACDGILVTAAAPHVPPPLLEQLAIGGRLVIPLGDLSTQELVIVTRGRDGWTERHAGGVRFVPLVSSLAFTEPVEP